MRDTWLKEVRGKEEGVRGTIKFWLALDESECGGEVEGRGRGGLG